MPKNETPEPVEPDPTVVPEPEPVEPVLYLSERHPSIIFSDLGACFVEAIDPATQSPYRPSFGSFEATTQEQIDSLDAVGPDLGITRA